MKSERSGGLGRPAVVASVLTLVSAAALTWGLGRAQAGGAGVQQAAVAGNITTVAGGVGGPDAGTAVSLGPGQNNLCGITYGSGALYVADSDVVREVSPQTGRLTTPVGTGTAGPLGDGGPAASAELSTCGATLDHSGNLVIADLGGSRIRVVAASTGTFYGQAMTAGDIYTVAGTGLFGFTGEGHLATTANLDGPSAVAVDGAGNLVIADSGNERVRVVAARAGTFYGQAMTAGDIYTVAGTGTFGFSGEGGPATGAELDGPRGVTVDGAGNLVIADRGNNRVRVVAVSDGTFYGQAMPAGDIYTVAGTGTFGFSADGGPATAAELASPGQTAVDGAGNLVIADWGNNRVRVVAASTGTLYGQAMTAGDIYTVAGTGQVGFGGEGGLATAAKLDGPQDVAFDGAGNLVIADSGNDRIRVVAARTGSFYGRAMTVRHIYTVAGNGTFGFSGDGGAATAAELRIPQDAVVDSAGNLVITDSENYRVRVVAASTGTFYGQAMTAGDIYTVAGTGTLGFAGDGGPALSAELNRPQGVAVDAAGDLLVVDVGSNRIREVAG